VSAPLRAKPVITRGSLFGRWAVALLLAPLRWLPRGALGALASLVAWIAWGLRLRRAVTLDNLAQALPEKPLGERLAIARGAYRTMALAALEAAVGLGQRLSASDAAGLVRVDDWKGLDAILEAGQPALIATAHFGSWELLAAVMSRRGYRLSAVVRPLSGAFNEWIVRQRAASGLEVILQRGAVRDMLQALRRGRAVIQLIDQVLPARAGLFVPFFGRPACTTPALSMVALRTGVPVYVALAAREGDGLRLVIDGPFPVPRTGDRRADVATHVATLTACLEAAIRRHPEQWLWLHRRWKVLPSTSTTAASPLPVLGGPPR
jgi:KDO2-lipid IV(A) lauroyltransferase